MLKRLYEDGDLQIERILTREQKRLKLTSHELVVLLALFSLYKRRTFSLLSLSRRIEYDKNEIGDLIDKLLDKQFLTIDLESKDGKQREVFSLDLTFDKLRHLYEQDEKALLLEKYQTEIGKTLSALEKAIGKTLSAYEIDLIRSWYEKQTYKHQDIARVIQEQGYSSRFSVKMLERQLLQLEHKLTVEPNDQADAALDKIFKAIK